MGWIDEIERYDWAIKYETWMLLYVAGIYLKSSVWQASQVVQTENIFFKIKESITGLFLDVLSQP